MSSLENLWEDFLLRWFFLLLLRWCFFHLMLFISCCSTSSLFREPSPGLSLQTLTHFILSVRNPILYLTSLTFHYFPWPLAVAIVVVVLRPRVLWFERAFFTLRCFLPYTPCCCFSFSSSYVAVVVVLLSPQVLRIWEIFINPRMFSTLHSFSTLAQPAFIKGW